MTAGELPLIVAGWLLSFLMISFLAGDLFLKWALRDEERFNNLPTKLLAGILCVSSALAIGIFVLPLRLAVDWIILLFLVTILWFLARRGNYVKFQPTGNLPESIFVLVIPLLVTAWCRDILRPMELNGTLAVIRAWPDIFFHMCQIESLTSSRGIGSISDVSMVGATAHPYHIASYLLPAVLADVSGISGLIAFSSLLVPLGILLTALAAYSMGNLVFGKWPALAAGLGLMLLPDAFQQGLSMRFFSYHWSQQVGPAQCYGVACAAFAFTVLNR